MNEITEVIEQATARTLPLHASHIARHATMTERDGWLQPAHFGGARAEYDAVRGATGAGLFDLSSRGRIEVSGTEAVMFLNGMITNDVPKLEEGAWMLAAFPNVQGRLIAFARVLKTEAQTFLFDTEAATHTAVLKALQRFTLAGDFHVRDLREELALLSLQGAGAAEVIRQTIGEEAANIARGRVLSQDYRGGTLHMIRATHTTEDGFDLFVNTSQAATLYDELVAAGAHPCGVEALELLRVEAGIPRHGVDITDQSVVLEAGQDEAISYTKGCYVGQEIIARIHWRGHVAKRLAGVVFEADPAIEVGAQLMSATDGKDAGRITSRVVSPALNRPVALAMLRYAYLAPGTELVSGGEHTYRARVVELPFVRGSWETDAQTSDEGQTT